MNYELYLTEKLNTIKNTRQYDINIEISTEQAFAKIKTFDPKTVYVIIKYLTSSITLEAKTQPIQILCLAEQNQIDISRALFDEFANTYNWVSYTEGTTYTKQQYSTPVVLSNFNEVGFGYRSVIYIAGTLYIMEEVVDVEGLEIDDNSITPLTFSMSYAMTGNTQPVGNSYIATTVKNIATLSITMSIPMTNTDLVEKVISIMSGDDSGNQDFKFNFTLDGVEFDDQNFKLISASFVTAPNSVPALQLGFMR